MFFTLELFKRRPPSVRAREIASYVGLVIVANLSSSWGYYRTPTGKAVYFTLAFQDGLAEEAGPAAPDENQVSEQEADEQECMADLNRHLDEPSQEGGAQDAEQADQGGSHRGGAGAGG